MINTVHQFIQKNSPVVGLITQISFEAARGWLIVWFVLMLVSSLLSIISIDITRRLVDFIAEQVNTIESVTDIFTSNLLWIGFIWVIFYIVKRILPAFIAWFQLNHTERIRKYLQYKIHQKATELDLSYFELPDYYDDFQITLSHAPNQVLSLINGGGQVLKIVFTLGGMVFLLLTYSLWFPLIVIIITAIPTFFIARYNARKLHEWYVKSNRDKRLNAYYGSILTDRRHAQERILFNIAPFYQGLYQSLLEILMKGQLREGKRDLRLGIAVIVIRLVATLVILGWMAIQYVDGIYTLGIAVAFYQITTQSLSASGTLLNQVGRLQENMQFSRKLFRYLDLQPIVKNKDNAKIAQPLMEGITIDNITFRYSGNVQPTLQNLSITIPAGKVVAIVGENGEGKSTLMRLVCRLYDPDAGRVLWDGTDLRDLDIKSLHEQISVLFQYPNRYSTSVKENVWLSHTPSDINLMAIKQAVQSAGAASIVDKLDDGYDTLLGKNFGGTDLSFGEWQRLALSRAFFRPASLVILDEPTSAMDSWSEARWLSRVKAVLDSRTALIITHRFSVAMEADIIYVLKNSQIIESGTHEALLQQQGAYARAWYAQQDTVKRDLIDIS